MDEIEDGIKENLDHIAEWNGSAWTALHCDSAPVECLKREVAKTKGSGIDEMSKKSSIERIKNRYRKGALAFDSADVLDLLVIIDNLESQLTTRDALTKRLVYAGWEMRCLALVSGDNVHLRKYVKKWDELAAEWEHRNDKPEEPK